LECGKRDLSGKPLVASGRKINARQDCLGLRLIANWIEWRIYLGMLIASGAALPHSCALKLNRRMIP
jgi:hypothetical protein